MRALSIDQLERHGSRPVSLAKYAAAFCRIRLVLLETADLATQLPDLGVLGDREPVPLTTLDLVPAHPVTQRLRAEPEPTPNRGNRLTALTLQPASSLNSGDHFDGRAVLLTSLHSASAEYQDVNESGSTPTHGTSMAAAGPDRTESSRRDLGAARPC